MSKNGESSKPKNDEISSSQSIRCRICGEVFENNRSLANHFWISHMGGRGTLAVTPNSSNQAENRQLLNPPKNHVLALNRAATLQVGSVAGPSPSPSPSPRRFLPPNVTTIITPRPTLPITLGQLVERVGETHVCPDKCMPLLNQLDRPIPEVIYVDDSDDDVEDLDLTLRL